MKNKSAVRLESQLSRIELELKLARLRSNKATTSEMIRTIVMHDLDRDIALMREARRLIEEQSNE